MGLRRVQVVPDDGSHHLELLFGSNEATQRRALLALQQMGFAAVAWTYEVNGRLGASHSCQITRPRQEACSAPSSSSFTRPVRQHTRLTVHVEDQLHLSAMLTSRSVLLSYDLVAVVPHSELAFEKAMADVEAVVKKPIAEGRPSYDLGCRGGDNGNHWSHGVVRDFKNCGRSSVILC